MNCVLCNGGSGQFIATGVTVVVVVVEEEESRFVVDGHYLEILLLVLKVMLMLLLVPLEILLMLEILLLSMPLSMPLLLSSSNDLSDLGDSFDNACQPLYRHSSYIARSCYTCSKQPSQRGIIHS